MIEIGLIIKNFIGWVLAHKKASAIIVGVLLLTIFVGYLSHKARKAEQLAAEERKRASQAISDAQQETIEETRENLTNINANLANVQNANLSNLSNDELRNRIINAAKDYRK